MNNTIFDHDKFRIGATIADNTISAHLKTMDISDVGASINHMNPPPTSDLLELIGKIDSTIANLKQAQKAITKLIAHG